MRRIVVALAAVIACSSPSKPGPSPAVPAGPTPSPAVQTAERDPAPPALRVPGDVRPSKYALDLTIVPERDAVPGVVKIDASIVRPTRVVWLNATDLKIGEAKLNAQPARVIAGGPDFIGLTLDRELKAGPLAIEIAFTATIERTKSQGIYAEREGNDTYAYTFFEAIDARRAFPCFDEPEYKVPWQLTFHVQKGHVALGNAAVTREADEPDGMKRVELAVSKPLPSYLVAFVVGPFELVDGGLAGRVKTPIRFIIPKGRAGELHWAKEITPRVVAALEDYFDMDYPFGKLDVAVVPRYWGTMEHPGIVAMGQPLTLIRPDQETRSRKKHYANILAHELAHYWFGDVVTMKWWDDTWLNESLGTWMDMIITDAVEPSWRHRDERVGLATQAMESDEALATRAIRQPVTTRDGIGASFDNGITYFKGATVMRMFEAYVGTTKWRDAIRAYIRAFEFRNATADDLLSTIRDRLDPTIETAMRTFLEQPGVPHIRAELACKAGDTPKLVLHQTRALPAGVQDATQARTWHVPVCVRYGDKQAARTCMLLDRPDAELALDGVKTCPTWWLLNADANGYYRSSADPAIAKALLTPTSAIAKVAKPTTAEKSMLIADLRAMVDRDELAFDQLLALTPLIAADPDEKTAIAAFEAASFRTDVLDDALYAKARKFVVRTFGPTARKLGWARARTDSDERHQLRRAFVPAVADKDPTLAKQAATLADRWLRDRTGVDDEMVDAVLRTAARDGNQARFDKMVEAVKHARDRTEKQRLLRALGYFKDPAIATRALELVSGTELDLRDTLTILYTVAFNRETQKLALAFITQHIDELLGRMRDDEAAGFLGALASGFCTTEQRQAIAELVPPRAAKFSGAEAVVKRGLEQSEQCIKSAERQLPAIKRFLDRY
ncbi:MAG: M1 family peptidase [Kofleriaceae bacterium]|nr:M1 family peptidase [Kofleriaceae bacterium]